MRCDHEHDDGAYVLGALSPAERSEYERHLANCSFCRDAVAEIAVLPGLLGRLDPADFADLAEPAERPRMPELVARARTDRRRQRRAQRWRYAGSALVAASLALVIGLVLSPLRRDAGADRSAPTPTATASPEIQMIAMQPVKVGATLPITAEVGIRPTTWGTEVSMRCGYKASDTHKKAYTYRLVAFGPDDEKEQVSTWVAAPGQVVGTQGSIRFSAADLVRFELQRFDGTPVLVYNLK